jgi:hypothetical protein
MEGSNRMICALEDKERVEPGNSWRDTSSVSEPKMVAIVEGERGFTAVRTAAPSTERILGSSFGLWLMKASWRIDV